MKINRHRVSYFACQHLCKKGRKGGEENICTFANICMDYLWMETQDNITLVGSAERDQPDRVEQIQQ